MAGSHDLTDWVLYQNDAEIIASRNDNVNKLNPPTSIMEAMKESTQYVLKVRYHDAINDIWSEFGSVESTTAEKWIGENDIGIPGEMGFGVGYTNDQETLNRLKLKALEGTNNPNHDNYGSYVSTVDNESIFTYVPAFCYSFEPENIGEIAKQRSPVNAMHIKSFKDFNYDEATANAAGYTLHRSFIDGGKPQKGFFFSKYIMSKGVKSVKNGSIISLCGNDLSDFSSKAEGGEGKAWDALTLSKNKFGNEYNCASGSMHKALAMLAQCHGQYATDFNKCFWLDIANNINFPKGCNNSLGDINNPNITYTNSDTKNPKKPDTGSASSFKDITHNGQNCGVCDLNGCIEQVAIEAIFYGNTLYVAPDSAKLTDYTKDNVQSTNSALYTSALTLEDKNLKWGNASKTSFYPDKSGINRALCTLWPAPGGDTGTNEFGNDQAFSYCIRSNDYGLLRCAGSWSSGASASVWYICMNSSNSCDWDNAYVDCGFRTAAY